MREFILSFTGVLVGFFLIRAGYLYLCAIDSQVFPILNK